MTTPEDRSSGQRLHVVIVCPGLGGAGSVGGVALRHATELAGRFDITLVSDMFPRKIASGVHTVLVKKWGFRYLRRYARVPLEIAFVVRARWAIGRLHKVRPVDFVICHGHTVAAIAATSLQRKFAIPYALVTHGDIFDRPVGTYDPRLTWLYRKVTPPAYRHANLVVAISPHMAGLAIRGGAKESNVVVIPNGIDIGDIGLADAQHALLPRANPKFTIQYVGRLSIEKGVDIIISAVGLLKDMGLSVELRIAGSGPLEPRLREQAKMLNLESEVSFLGHVDRMSLGNLYCQCDVVCVPSRSEPLSLAVLEAMAAGAPVIASDVGGIPSIITSGMTGFLCSPDPQAFAEQLAALIRNPERLGCIADNGRNHVLYEFSWQRLVSRLADALENTRRKQAGLNRLN